MTFATLREVLDSLVQAHEKLRQFFRRSDFNFNDQQEQLLAESLEQDQIRIEEAIKDYFSNDSFADVLRMRIQFAFEDGIDRQLKILEQVGETNFTAMVDSVAQFYSAVSSFVARVNEQAESEAASRLLDDLEQMESEAAKSLSGRLNGLYDC